MGARRKLFMWGKTSSPSSITFHYFYAVIFF